jgi:hypothetical protein
LLLRTADYKTVVSLIRKKWKKWQLGVTEAREAITVTQTQRKLASALAQN